MPPFSLVEIKKSFSNEVLSGIRVRTQAIEFMVDVIERSLKVLVFYLFDEVNDQGLDADTFANVTSKLRIE